MVPIGDNVQKLPPLHLSPCGCLSTDSSYFSVFITLLSRFSRVRLCAIPWTAAHQAPPSLGFSRQEHWSGLPFPSPMRESEVAQSCPTLCSPMNCSPQAPLSMGFSRQEYWSGVPLPLVVVK